MSVKHSVVYCDWCKSGIYDGDLVACQDCREELVTDTCALEDKIAELEKKIVGLEEEISELKPERRIR